jgi:TRAP-type C4-dicarboxylate transport system permease small subunit
MKDRVKLNRIYDFLESLVNWTDRIELVLTFACMMAIVMMGSMEIFARYVLNTSLFFVYEITILLANWMYFLGFCLVFKRNRDIEIEFFFNKMNPKVRRMVTLLTNCAIFYFLAILTYYTFKLLIIQSKHSTEGLGIPNHYFSLPIFIGTLSIITICVKNLLAIYLDLEKA